MQVCETARLVIRHFDTADAAFIVRLLNDETFIENIGDKKVSNQSDAINYLMNGPFHSYQQFGFGLNIVLIKDTLTPIGMCGLLQREQLEHPDLGYALLPDFCHKGYAQEAATAVINEGHTTHGLAIIAAFTSPKNTASNRLLKKMGFDFIGLTQISGSEDNLYQYHFMDK